MRYNSYRFQRGNPRLEPPPWTGRTWRKRLSELTTTVKAKSAYGIKVEEDGDWWNWSKPEYRGEPFNLEVQKGDRVQITYAEADNGKVYISTIDKVVVAPPVGHPITESLHDDPFPPEEEYRDLGDDRAFPTDAGREPSEPTIDKDHSIVRQVCIKAACMTLQHHVGNAEQKAGEVTYLAGVLEDWCWR